MNIGASTILFVVLIILSSVGGWWYINHCKKNRTLISNRRWIEQIPSLISTLGVLGTFWGITDGLLDFDTNDLNLSIPFLLDGLKTAFLTSLAGMIGSLILSRVVSSSFDKEDGGMSDVDMATSQIVKAVEAQAKNQTAFYASVLETMSAIQGYTESIENSINTLSVHAQSQSTILTKVTTQLTDIHSMTGEIATASEAMSSSNEEVAKGVQQFGEILHGEVLDIEDKMSATNKLLNAKFDEFTELLKKSNTEALVEVMKSVTAEFQKQMNELISKLVQENFEQLNQSVERLNVWQQENKEMINSLTSQYRQMADNFEETSTTLTQVGTDTKMLVSDGGKLQQLITSLNQVIIEDEHFVEITANLSHTAELSKTNMEEFEESTKALNEWVKKQRNFVDGVTMLIEKLDELNKIRDYNEAFWRDTKSKLEEGVGYITEGSKSLNQQLTNLDKQFYARLSATLAELDACISAMIKKNNYLYLYCDIYNMKKIAYELYNPYLTISENAQKLGCSVVSMKRYLRDKEVDRKFDGIYVKWKKVQDYYKQNPNSSLREASIELGISINTIRKYKNLSEEELSVSKKDKIKVTSFDIKNKNAIKSISYSQTDILSWIMKLYNDGKPFDCDLTASKCIFWKSLPKPQHLYDKYPQVSGVKPLPEADLLPDECFESIVYDLPFIVSSGAMSKMKERFTHFENIEELYAVNDEMFERSYRLLKKNGILIVKTMDISHRNKQVWVSDYIIRKAEEKGMEMIERFILLSNLRLFSVTHKQNIARKYHSYFLIFKK